MPARVDLPLIRTRDRTPVGTLTIVWVNHWSFADDVGKRRVSPIMLDQLLITLTDAKGEEIAYIEVPMAKLSAWPHLRSERRTTYADSLVNLAHGVGK